VARIAAEAAGLLDGVDDPSFVVEGVLLAGGGHIRQNAAAHGVVPAVCAVDSLADVCGVVEKFTIDVVGSGLRDNGLVEADAVGEVEDGGIFGEHGCGEGQEQEDQFHCNFAIIIPIKDIIIVMKSNYLEKMIKSEDD
jgi:hypothetical protein